jgi:hypothetical protein
MIANTAEGKFQVLKATGKKVFLPDYTAQHPRRQSSSQFKGHVKSPCREKDKDNWPKVFVELNYKPAC